MQRLNILILLIFTAAAFSCATTSSNEGGFLNGTGTVRTETEIQKKLQASAEYMLGKESLDIDGRHFNMDCSGTVLAIYYHAGIDLEKSYALYEGNGVRRIYQFLRDNSLIHTSKTPSPGDLIFWDNTYDRNEDGKFNDYFTHVGMVVDIDSKGNITYIHENYRKGIVYESMNLQKPDNTRLNSPMRMKGSPPDPEGRYLSSHLLRVFGRAWEVPKEYFIK